MKQFLTFLILLSILVGCSPRQKVPEIKSQVVIVVDGLAYSERYYYNEEREEGGYTATIGNKVFEYLSANPNETIKNIEVRGDTTVIPLNAEWMFVKYNFNPLSSSDFTVRKGDTVLIKRDTAKVFSRAQPRISILNRQALPLDTDYRSAYLQRFGSYGSLTIGEMANNPRAMFKKYDFKISKGRNAYKELQENHHMDVLKVLEEENVWLDSLNSAGLLSQPAYNYFKENVKWVLKQRDVFGYKISVPESKADSLILADFSKEKWISDIYGFYKRYINAVASSSYFSKGVKISQGSTIDWEYTFDKLVKDTIIKDIELYETYMIRTLDGMLQDYPKHKSKKFVEMAIAYTEPTLSGKLQERYKDAFAQEQMVENDVLLISPDGDRTTLTNVLTSMQGKVVYLDFWASWCSPCCAEMGPAAELRSKLQGENIEFLYLSKDEDHDKMCQSLEKLELKGCRVYRILNPKAAKFLYEYNINLIPRYMIIDKNGKIVNDNAPRPSSEGIEQGLKGLLK